ncbi:MAG TPA: helicase-related protein, partial [Burkholderiales bacterium]
VSPRNTAAELVQQTVHLVKKEQKRDVLSHLIRANAWQQVLVFTRTKHGANRLADKLERDGIAAVAIHGNKSQAARTRALAQFKAGEVPVLVATDIAARGLDIEELPHVVNFELPNVAEDYLHRIGRTGRAGSSGAAVSLVDSEEIQMLRDIEKLLKRPIERAALQGFVPVERTSSERAAEDDRRAARPSRNDRPHRDRQPQGKGARPASQAPSTRERSGNRRNETPGNRATSSRDDSRGNRPRSGAADDGRGNRTGRVGRDETPRHVRRDEAAGNRGRHVHRGEAQPNRTHRMPRDPATGNGAQAVWREEVDGNRAQATAESQASDAMSEAARHQAQAQPALFSPKPQQRRRG